MRTNVPTGKTPFRRAYVRVEVDQVELDDPHHREADRGRGSLMRVMLRRATRGDFDDIPKGARDALEFIWLERVDQAVEAALDPPRNESGPRLTSPPRDFGAAGRLGRHFRYEIGRRH